MMRMIAWFLLGGLIVACIGGPVVGAISGLFWPHFGGGHTEAGAAARIEGAIYNRNFTEGDLNDIKTFYVSECPHGMALREFNRNSTQADQVFVNLNAAISREQDLRKRHVGDRVANEALMKLPYPILGALEGCIAHSLLAPLCEANVQRIKHTARQNASDIIARDEAKNDADWEKVWCTADRAFSAQQ